MHKVRDLLETRRPRAAGTRIIGVDGRGGSGKSTLARLLASSFVAEVVHTDDFASPENPLDWYGDLIEKVLVPISKGAKTLRYVPTKWWENHDPQPVTGQPVTPVMILEGVSALRREFREYLALAIFVDAPREVCIRRGLERDRLSGKPEAMLRKMWDEWADEEERYFERDNPKAYADIVIDGTQPVGDQIGL